MEATTAFRTVSYCNEAHEEQDFHITYSWQSMPIEIVLNTFDITLLCCHTGSREDMGNRKYGSFIFSFGQQRDIWLWWKQRR